MNQQLWGQVDSKRKRGLENKRIRMFLYNRNDTIELDIEYYLSNALTAGIYIYIYINNKVICSDRMRIFQTKLKMIHFIKHLHKICFKTSCNQYPQ